MSPTETPVPFRWNITQSSELGTLLKGEILQHYDGFADDLLACAAQIVALSGDSDIVFLGRSPESLYDVLSALLADTTWQRRLTLLPFSARYLDEETANQKHSEAVASFRVHLNSLSLSPAKLIVRERPVAIVDLLCSGNTFHKFFEMIRDWSLEEKADWPSVQRKLRAVAIVRQDDLNPKPRWKLKKERRTMWRWRNDADWIDELFERGAFRQAAVSRCFWEYLGDHQIKTIPSFTSEDWGTDESAIPCRKEHNLRALRLARQLFEVGLTKPSRAQFTAFLAAQEVGMREAWCRRLVGEVRGIGSN